MDKYKPITINRRAKFDYNVKDRLLAGIVLIGTEVKSIRRGDTDLHGAFVTIRNDGLWLNNTFIPPYQSGQDLNDYDPTRARKLLVHKRQLQKLTAAKQNGFHIIPMSLGKQGRFIKVEVGVGKSKKKRDKREAIKKRTASREAARHIKRRHN